LLTVAPLQVTVGAVIAVPAVPDGGTKPQASTEDIVNLPQLAVLLLPPQLAVASTSYVEAVGSNQVGAFVQVMPLLTMLVPHLTIGCAIAVPATPVIGMPVQVSSSTEGAALTVNVPLQLATLPLQFPKFATTPMLLYVPISGSFQFGAPVQLKPLLTTVPLQVTVGGVIVVLAMPVEGTAAQASVYVTGLELLELRTTAEELLRYLLLLGSSGLSRGISPQDMKNNIPTAKAALANCVAIVCSPC